MPKTKFIILSQAKDFEYAKCLVDELRKILSVKVEQSAIVLLPEIVALSDDNTFFNVLGFMKDSVGKAKVVTYKNEKKP